MTFIDYYSGKFWAYIIKSKDQVLDYFQNFHEAVEQGTRFSLKVVRSDNKSKYISMFEEYYRKHGSNMRTVSKTLQQNGLSERINCTIYEKA